MMRLFCLTCRTAVANPDGERVWKPVSLFQCTCGPGFLRLARVHQQPYQSWTSHAPDREQVREDAFTVMKWGVGQGERPRDVIATLLRFMSLTQV